MQSKAGRSQLSLTQDIKTKSDMSYKRYLLGWLATDADAVVNNYGGYRGL